MSFYYTFSCSNIKALRSVIAGFVGIGQVLRLVDITQEAGEDYRRRCLNATEPLLTGVKERVIRLVGTESDVTNLSISRLGFHIVPIAEKPEMCKPMIEEMTMEGMYPAVFHIENKKYGARAR